MAKRKKTSTTKKKARTRKAAARAKSGSKARAKAPARGKATAKRGAAAKAKGPKKDGRLGVLSAAAKVLAETKKPMRSKDMVEAMLAKGYWKTAGKTPHATLSAAIGREIAAKGKASRFRKTDRGVFTLQG